MSALLLVPAAVLNLRRPQYGEISFTTGELALGLGFVAFGWFGALSLWPQRGVAMLRIDVPDPVGLFGLVYNLGEWGVIVAAVAAAASLVVRFRRAGGIERQQLKWLLYAAVMFGVAIPLVSIVLAGLGVSSELAVDAVGAVLVAGLPAALGVAILKYRLYDIDRIINRTLVYGLLTATLGLAYAGVVLVLGQLFGEVGGNPPSWAVAGATLTVAALFQPTRRRIQQEVDRRFNRRRFDAARTVEAFSARLREQVDLDTLSTELLGVVDQTVQPTVLSLWLRPPAQASSSSQGWGR
jgi:hypothetical protein